MLNLQPVERRPPAQPLADLLADHDRRQVGIGPRHEGHDRDSQSLGEGCERENPMGRRARLSVDVLQGRFLQEPE